MNKAIPYVIGAALMAGALTPLYFVKHASPDDKKGNHYIAADKATDIQKISYALGYQVSSQTPPELNTEQFLQGFEDGHAKKKPQYTEEQISAALAAYQQAAQKKQLAAQQGQDAASQDNAQAGKAFLVENAKKTGVVTTASGLQYEVLKQGTGAQPTATSQVTVHYEGKLINGTVFDSSIARKEPITFALNQVIPGWTEGVQLMKEGSKYRFFIPAELAYGAQDTGTIPPNSTLIFEVELIKVVS